MTIKTAALFLSLLFGACGFAQDSQLNGSYVVTGTVNYCGSDTGSGNAYACAFPTGNTILSYVTGATYSFKATHANTGAVTLAIDGLTATAIKKVSGGALVPLVTGDIPNGTVQTVHYDGTVFEMGSAGGSSGSGVSQRVVYTSAISTVGFGDAVVAPGSNTQGTDQAAIFNTALSGGNIHLIVDGQYGLSTYLKVYSNTTISVLPGDGFIMQTASQGTLIRNANQNAATAASGTGGYLVSNITDQNIVIDGGIWNSNSTNSTTASDHRGDGTYIYFGFSFIGVNGLNVKNVELYDPPTYGIGATNVENVHVDGGFYHVPMPIVTRNNGTIQIDGPAKNLWLSNIHFITGDDAIALNADDCTESGWGSYYCGALNPPGWRHGPITNAYVSNIFLDNTQTGVRLLSSTELEDNIFVHNVSGSTVSQSFEADNYFSALGNGNFGSITVDGYKVANVSTANGGAVWNYTGTTPVNAQMLIAANIKNLRIGDVSLINPPVENWPLIWVYSNGSTYTVQNLTLNNIAVYNPTGTAVPIIVRTDKPVYNLSASNLNWVDASGGTGVMFGGSSAPTLMAASSSAIPGTATTDRLLASGYHPTAVFGSAFMPFGDTSVAALGFAGHVAFLNGVTFEDVNTQPSCTGAIEGTLWYNKGSGSSNGSVQMCQNQSGTFLWVTH